MVTTTLFAIQTLRNQINNLDDALKQEFRDNLTELFANHPTLASFECRVNNHEFNDGNATRFYIGYDYATLTLKDGTELEDPRDNPIANAIEELFSKYASAGLIEDLFGHHYDSLAISSTDFALD